MRVHTTAITVSILSFLMLIACGDDQGGSSVSGAASNLPVITSPAEAKDYPLAGVEGRLELRDGCLVLGGDVVYWPYGTTWDGDADAVVFRNAPQFADAAPARVDAVFSGGGAFYPADTDFRSWFGDDFAKPIEGCQKALGIKDVVFAYPTPAP